MQTPPTFSEPCRIRDTRFPLRYRAPSPRFLQGVLDEDQGLWLL